MAAEFYDWMDGEKFANSVELWLKQHTEAKLFRDEWFKMHPPPMPSADDSE